MENIKDKKEIKSTMKSSRNISLMFIIISSILFVLQISINFVFDVQINSILIFFSLLSIIFFIDYRYWSIKYILEKQFEQTRIDKNK